MRNFSTSCFENVFLTPFVHLSNLLVMVINTNYIPGSYDVQHLAFIING